MIQTLQKMAQSKQSSKSAIAFFLIENLDRLGQLSLEDIAKSSYTSKSSVVRFAQSLGYKGWSDFLPALLSERYYSKTHYSDIDHNLPFNKDDTLESIIQKIATIEKESIQDTADKMDIESLNYATQYIHQANRIVLFGLSPNEYLGHLFKRKMLAIGKVIEVCHPGEFGLMSSSLNEKDVAIIISYSGTSKTIESLQHLDTLKKNKTKIIAITSENGKLLQSYADTSLLLCTKEDNFKKIGNFSTEESILFVLNAIYAAYFKKDFYANYVKKINTASHLEEKR